MNNTDWCLSPTVCNDGKHFVSRGQVIYALEKLWNTYTLPALQRIKELENAIKFEREEGARYVEAYRQKCVEKEALEKENGELKARLMPNEAFKPQK